MLNYNFSIKNLQVTNCTIKYKTNDNELLDWKDEEISGTLEANNSIKLIVEITITNTGLSASLSGSLALSLNN